MMKKIIEHISDRCGTKRILWTTLAFLCVLGAIGAYLVSHPENKIALRGFTPESEVMYEILAQNGDLLERISAITDDKGDLELVMPDQVSSGKEEVTYNLNIKTSQRASDEDHDSFVKSLNMVLNLKPEENSVVIAGSGVSEYADILIKKGNMQQHTKADWSGNFFADFGNFVGQEKSGEPIELAFQTFNYGDDVSLGQTNKVEVYYDSIGDVFSYMYFFGRSDGSSQGQRDQWARALTDMITEFSAVMVMQTFIIGSFFDAEMQMEVQRKAQELRARAHKDYHPSDQMCRFGTFMRSVARTERKGELTKAALNKVLMDDYLAVSNSSTADGPSTGLRARLEQFKDKYCDPRDNGHRLDIICPLDTSLTPDQQRQARARYNKDIDYARTIDAELTLDLDYLDVATVTEDEEDVIALARNLYYDQILEQPSKLSMETDLRGAYRARSYAAKQSVAHNSFINIVGMKASAMPGPAGTVSTALPDLPESFRMGPPYTNTPAPTLATAVSLTPTLTTPANARNNPPYGGPYYDPALTEDAGWIYMKALLREFGIAPIDMNGDGDTTDVGESVDEQIDEILGERPSYYAQMEVLTKKIYLHPNFFTNLYDKPANVKRIGAALEAISLMHMRDRYESMLRREMIGAVLLEQGLQKHVDKVNSTISSEIKQPPPI